MFYCLEVYKNSCWSGVLLLMVSTHRTYRLTKTNEANIYYFSLLKVRFSSLGIIFVIFIEWSDRDYFR